MRKLADPYDDEFAKAGNLSMTESAREWPERLTLAVAALQADLHTDVERALAQHFGSLHANVEQAVHAAVEDALHEYAESLRLEGKQQWTAELAQFARRMQRARNREAWAHAVLDASAKVASRCVLLEPSQGRLAVLGERPTATDEDQKYEAPADDQESLLPLAPAFQSALDSQDIVVCLRTASELSSAFMDRFAIETDGRALLLPMLSHEGPALLYAEADNDRSAGAALEVIARLAGGAAEPSMPEAEPVQWPGPQPVPAEVAGGLIQIAGVSRAAVREIPRWHELSANERAVHLRAQTTAKQLVQRLQTHQQAMAEGRAERNLYGHLRGEIETARSVFRQQFMSAVPSMVDYLHLELLKTLAQNQYEVLGSQYPGPMV